MTPFKIVPATLAVIAIAAAVPAQAGVASGPREVVQTDYTTTHPAAPSGAIYDVTYRNPDDPHANPPAVRRVLIDSPRGARIRTSVPVRCDATDREFQLRGDAACPSGSKVGRGTVTTSVLGGPPTTSQISVYNTADGLVQLVKFGVFGAAAVRTRFNGADSDTRIPTCLTGGQPPKGCPSDQVVVLASRIVIRKVVRGGRTYIETPPNCPRKGWRTTLTYHYGDGKVESVTSRGTCRRKTARARAVGRRRVERAPLTHLALEISTPTARDGTPSVPLRARVSAARPLYELRGDGSSASRHHPAHMRTVPTAVAR